MKGKKSTYGALSWIFVVSLVFSVFSLPAVGYSVEASHFLDPRVKRPEVNTAKARTTSDWVSKKKKNENSIDFFMAGPLSKATQEPERLIKQVEKSKNDVTKLFKKGYKKDSQEEGPIVEVNDDLLQA